MDFASQLMKELLVVAGVLVGLGLAVGFGLGYWVAA